MRSWRLPASLIMLRLCVSSNIALTLTNLFGLAFESLIVSFYLLALRDLSSMADSNSNLALLIDGDNVSPKIITGLMTELANYGKASVRRIYGDWTRPDLKGWKACLLEHSITPFQQFAYTSGKNSTDGAMIIDAMDLLYTNRFSTFCIVSSDSDFIRLAQRIREQVCLAGSTFDSKMLCRVLEKRSRLVHC